MTQRVRSSRSWWKWPLLLLLILCVSLLAFRVFQRDIYLAIGYSEQDVCATLSDRDAETLARKAGKAMGERIDIRRDPPGTSLADTSVDVVFRDQNSVTGVVTARIFDDCSIDWHKDDLDI